MTRVKRGTTSVKTRRNLLKHTKGYRNTRKSKERQARQAIFKAWTHAFTHRKDRKGDFRRLWQIKTGAEARVHGLSYSKFIDLLKKNDVAINRKMLAELAEHEPKTFERIVKTVQKA